VSHVPVSQVLRFLTLMLESHPSFPSLVDNSSSARCFTDINLFCKEVDTFKNPVTATKLALS
jgi:hypothetical protein